MTSRFTKYEHQEALENPQEYFLVDVILSCKAMCEAFQAEHADELKRLRKAICLREKLSKKPGVSLPRQSVFDNEIAAMPLVRSSGRALE